jgi:hypothetical protein
MKRYVPLFFFFILVLGLCSCATSSAPSQRDISVYHEVHALNFESATNELFLLAYDGKNNELIRYQTDKVIHLATLSTADDLPPAIFLELVYFDEAAGRIFVQERDIKGFQTHGVACYDLAGKLLWRMNAVDYPSIAALPENGGYLLCDSALIGASTFTFLDTSFNITGEYTSDAFYSPALLQNDANDTLFAASTVDFLDRRFQFSRLLAKISSDGVITYGDSLSAYPAIFFDFAGARHFIGMSILDDYMQLDTGLTAFGTDAICTIDSALYSMEVCQLTFNDKWFRAKAVFPTADKLYLVGLLIDIHSENVEAIRILEITSDWQISIVEDIPCDTYFDFLVAEMADASFEIIGMENDKIVHYVTE